jgi:hypothetical protein
MIYFEPKLKIPTLEQLKSVGDSIKTEFPNGPKIKTTYPDRKYEFNEISQNLFVQLKNI